MPIAADGVDGAEAQGFGSRADGTKVVSVSIVEASLGGDDDGSTIC